MFYFVLKYFLLSILKKITLVTDDETNRKFFLHICEVSRTLIWSAINVAWVESYAFKIELQISYSYHLELIFAGFFQNVWKIFKNH